MGGREQMGRGSLLDPVVSGQRLDPINIDRTSQQLAEASSFTRLDLTIERLVAEDVPYLRHHAIDQTRTTCLARQAPDDAEVAGSCERPLEGGRGLTQGEERADGTFVVRYLPRYAQRQFTRRAR